MAGQTLDQRPPLVRIDGRRNSSDGYAIRDFLHRRDIPFEWVELDSDEAARVNRHKVQVTRADGGVAPSAPVWKVMRYLFAWTIVSQPPAFR